MKGQLELKRLIKRNKKAANAITKASSSAKTSDINKPAKRAYKRKQPVPLCKIPFIVVKYTPAVEAHTPRAAQSRASLPYTMEGNNRMRLKSAEPLKCYGDSTVLGKLKLPKHAPGETLASVLGPVGEHLPATFKRLSKLTSQFTDKYKQ